MASTVETGRSGEDRAARVLRDEGMRIERRNYRGGGAEVDIVARDGDTLVFVEIRVRSRDDLGSALETVSRPKQARIARAAQHYLTFARPAPYRRVRFDVIGITAGDLVHVKDAFRANGR
jgi:putative endonuclease